MTAYTPRPAVNQPDFRAQQETPSVHNGKPIWLCVCDELVEGRWEGFVSIRRRSLSTVEG